MAVTRVFGTVDGVEVVLQHTQGDVWQVPVPLDQDGEYVVEIIAVDEAGNQSYLAKMLFIVNAALLCVHVIKLPFYATLLDSRYSAEMIANRAYGTSLEPCRFQATLQKTGYFAELIEPACALSGRR